MASDDDDNNKSLRTWVNPAPWTGRSNYGVKNANNLTAAAAVVVITQASTLLIP